MTILVAEDDAHLRAGLVELLGLEGYACVAVADGNAALAAFRDAKPSLCLLDVVMPDLDGLALVRAIRAEDTTVPILLLSARGAEMDRVIGLEIGADDYIAKPFSTREVVARVRASLRRVQPVAPGAPHKPTRITMDDLVIDARALRAHRGADAVDLTKRELAILLALHARRGQPISRDDLFDIGWGRTFMPNSRANTFRRCAARSSATRLSRASSAPCTASATVTTRRRPDENLTTFFHVPDRSRPARVHARAREPPDGGNAVHVFDDSNIRWNRVEGVDHVQYQVCEVDIENRTVDILFKFDARAKIVTHWHRAPYRTLVLQGELRIYRADGTLKEVRPIGSYVRGAASDEPHTEGGGDQDVIVFFSNRNVDELVYELIDEAGQTIATFGLAEFAELQRQQQVGFVRGVKLLEAKGAL